MSLRLLRYARNDGAYIIARNSQETHLPYLQPEFPNLSDGNQDEDNGQDNN